MMEKQIDRKIKVLQIDSVREYKDQFLRFGQNTSIGVHFTNKIHRVAKKINRSLLKKVQYLLFYASLDNTLWAKVLMYASHFMNYLSSTAIGGKTPLDIWSGGAAQDYSLLWVFGYPAYFSIKDGKLNRD